VGLPDSLETERKLLAPARSIVAPRPLRSSIALVESANVCGVDPMAYLIVVAHVRRTSGSVLLPADFAAERRSAPAVV